MISSASQAAAAVKKPAKKSRRSQSLRNFKASLRKIGLLPQARLSDAHLYEVYEDTFETVRATNAELREAAHRLRYQVYCVEQAFENPAEHPGGLETDGYDKHSVHSLLIHRRSGMLVGNVRIVLPQEDNLLMSFPMHRLVALPQLLDPDRVRISCEISRFCISKNFRKREGDGLYTGVFLNKHARPLSLFTKSHRQRVIPFTPLGLIGAVFEMTANHNIRWCYAILEPHLIRLLKKMGIECEVIAPVVEYHGERYPVEFDCPKISHSLAKKQPEVWKILTGNGELMDKLDALAKRYPA